MVVYFRSVVLFYFFYCVILVEGNDEADSTFQIEHFVFWPNGTIPFYIYPTHFDKEQSLAIMSSLSYFSFKTCLQFRPLIVEPNQNQHVMVFENPRGVRKCSIGMEGHGREEPHRITLGYECLKSPNIDMMVMKALGFPFEHNRASRDVFIDVQFENIESGFIPLFTKEKILPSELRALPYDVNSVMHFGEREYSKNGHRTIIFKNSNTKQHRIGLSKSDLRKIKIVYGPECQKRDRQAKKDICKNYPSSRKKREANLTVRSLRVNREITAPPDNLTDELTQSVNDLGIENEVQTLIDQIHKITAVALENARTKHCNNTKEKQINKTTEYNPNYDITKIVEVVRDYTKSIIDEVGSNLTIFCEDRTDFVPDIRCGWGKENCPVKYRSTKSGAVMYSTQHRPIIKQSTKPEIHRPRHLEWLRSNNTEERKVKDFTDEDVTTIKQFTKDYNSVHKERRKRDVTDKDITISNVTEDVLITETTAENKKVVNFAPVRKFGGGIFSFFDTKTKSEDKGDDSNISTENSKKHNVVKPNRDSERPKQRNRERLKKERHRDEEERNRDSQEDSKREVERRPKLKKQKERHKKRTNVPEIVELSKQNKEFYAERVWPDGIVRYVIEDDNKYDIQEVRERLEEVDNILKRKTCVRIEEVSEEEAKKYKDYLVLDTSPFYVTGRVGGRQNFGCIELFEGGQHRQHAAMMVMAMLGFYFEVSRHDRDKYIRVHIRHIRADKLHHFEKIRSDATLPVEYDYKSATHPPWQFWRKVGKKGISSIATYKDQDPDGSIMKSLGQNKQLLSDTDIIKINSVYGVKCFQNQRRAKIKHI